ncbi:hypothetical protein NDU88_003111 [Pleurodeles waltl]|uniref:Uncharacterized protein n=1 Tax=Pleurodeles waltl TaxID=8319 RepID=A0AAV7M2I6_PLEWA|nr:hypothetical protein NDU88_003111 [Pleurodeles waltl]
MPYTGRCCAQVRRALLRAKPELPRSLLRGARAPQERVGRLDGGEAAGQTRLRRLGYTLVRRALLRAEPELPRSRLRGARAAQERVGRLDGGEAAGQTRLRRLRYTLVIIIKKAENAHLCVS